MIYEWTCVQFIFTRMENWIFPILHRITHIYQFYLKRRVDVNIVHIGCDTHSSIRDRSVWDIFQ